jgi:hypothetical protein
MTAEDQWQGGGRRNQSGGFQEYDMTPPHKKRNARTANSEQAIRNAGGWGKLNYQERQFLRGLADSSFDNPQEEGGMSFLVGNEPQMSPQQTYDSLGGWSKLNYTDGQQILKGGKR